MGKKTSYIVECTTSDERRVVGTYTDFGEAIYAADDLFIDSRFSSEDYWKRVGFDRNMELIEVTVEELGLKQEKI